MEYKEGYIENNELKFGNTKQIDQAKLTPDCFLVQFKGLEACNTCELKGTDECSGGEILRNLHKKIYEIYWSDLNKKAQKRLKDLYHDNIDLSPLAIIDIEE